MSTVVAIKDKDKVWMGSDSFATTETGERRPIVANKILKNGKYLLGIIGSIRGSQLLSPHYFKPPSNILDFPLKVIDIFRDNGCLTITDTTVYEQACNILIGFKGNLYELMVDFQLNEVPQYSAVGSGSLFAFGSLHSTQGTSLTPYERIMKALEASACFDTGTGPPFLVHSI
jgi:ATP-dependent protease HslVU (ClpYQ) peptidase subunit